VITNERQYGISKTELQRFEEAAVAQRQEAPSEGVDPGVGVEDAVDWRQA
jgi:hypothetical protein